MARIDSPMALGRHPYLPPRAASGQCVLSAAAAGALAGVVSAFVEPSGWCVGAVLNVTWCAVCAFAEPSGGWSTTCLAAFRVREAPVPHSSTPPHHHDHHRIPR